MVNFRKYIIWSVIVITLVLTSTYFLYSFNQREIPSLKHTSIKPIISQKTKKNETFKKMDSSLFYLIPPRKIEEKVMDIKNQNFCVNLVTNKKNHHTLLKSALSTWAGMVEKLIITTDSLEGTEQYQKPGRYFITHGTGTYLSANERFFFGIVKLSEKFPKQCDFYMFADDDTFLVVPNLVDFLKKQDPLKSEVHAFYRWGVFSGGAGIILSNKCYESILPELKIHARGINYDVALTGIIMDYGKCRLRENFGLHFGPPQLLCTLSEVQAYFPWKDPPLSFHAIRTPQQMNQLQTIYNTQVQKTAMYQSYPVEPPKDNKYKPLEMKDIGVVLMSIPEKYAFEFRIRDDEKDIKWNNHWNLPSVEGDNISALEGLISKNPNLRFIFVMSQASFVYIPSFIVQYGSMKLDDSQPILIWNHLQREAGFIVSMGLAKKMLQLQKSTPLRDFHIHLAYMGHSKQIPKAIIPTHVLQSDGIFEWSPENYCVYDKMPDINELAYDNPDRLPLMKASAFFFGYVPSRRAITLQKFFLEWKGKDGKSGNGDSQKYLGDNWDPVVRVLKNAWATYRFKKQKKK